MGRHTSLCLARREQKDTSQWPSHSCFSGRHDRFIVHCCAENNLQGHVCFHGIRSSSMAVGSVDNAAHHIATANRC